MTIGERLGLLDDLQLERMKTRSYQRAARAWQEARAERVAIVRVMLMHEAESEEAFYNACLVEISRRREAARSAA